MIDDAVMRDQAVAVVQAPLPMLLVVLASRRIVEVSQALVDVAGAKRDDIVGADATQYLAGGPSPALPLLTAGQIDGYETTRWLRYPDGREARVHVWAHAFGDDRPPRTGLFVLDELSGAAPPEWSSSRAGITVLGAFDADWRIDRISADVEALLGYDAQTVTGQPFIGAVNPGDIADLLTGLGHAERSGETVIVRLRLRGTDGGWRWCRVWVAAIPKTAAFAFMIRPVSRDATDADLAQQLRERLARISYEANAATTLAAAAALPAGGDVTGLAKLTAREWLVVTALKGGARGSEIARTLNVAPSTVRNHLAAVYRKLGVNSQVELLAALSRQRTPHEPG